MYGNYGSSLLVLYIFLVIQRPIALNAIWLNPRNKNEFAVGGADSYVRVYDRRMLQGPQGDINPNARAVHKLCPNHQIPSSRNRSHLHITCVAYRYKLT